MISQQTIRQILGKIDIIDIVGGFVKLKKRGANFLGLCPFHNEKTPSFTVSPVKEIYKCFGCGRSGNAIGFLMEHEKYSYVEALRWLAAKYNIEVEETYSSPEMQLQQQTADSLFIINQFAQQYFSDLLFNSEEGQDIGMSYLKERNFREDVIGKFQLGYCLDRKDAFANHALAAQYNRDLLQKSGLIILREGSLFDNYRGRIIFPIHNQTGKILGFGARLIKNNDRAPKYINTPENEIYLKSRILYGMYFARKAIDKFDECLLVEGYTDVLSLHQAGIENVVASGGTSLTAEQLRLVKKYTDNLTIIYDGDAAGVKAALRGMDMAVEEGLNVKLVLIPGDDDPDSYLQKLGASAFRNFIEINRKDFILFRLEVSAQDAGSDSVKKAAVVNQVAETISKMNKVEEFTRQQDYIRKAADLLKIDEQGLNSLVNKFIADKIERTEARNSTERTTGGGTNIATPVDFSDETFTMLFQEELQEKALLRVLLTFGNRPFNAEKTVADFIFEEIVEEEFFKNEKVKKILKLYRDQYEAKRVMSVTDFTYLQDNDVVQLVINATNHPYELSSRWNDEDRAHSVNKGIWELDYDQFQAKVLTAPNARELIYYSQTDDNYKADVEDVLVYLKLKKIKRLIILNEEDLKKPNTDSEKVKHYQEVHRHLKNLQKELIKAKKTVIYPF